ncbi:phosphotransferase [Pararobbsia silviterrae]|uniref:Phosphotransferase n=1 Tax=Pararobbsia silviterrae TaxID=1792498 RepID=A0A494XI31_9BURK|nr:phosphotransferase [Pararobbsia silviterrae]
MGLTLLVVSGAGDAEPAGSATQPTLQRAAAEAAAGAASHSVDGYDYLVYYANLHSHTNHSDGGLAIERCRRPSLGPDGRLQEIAQRGDSGPAEAYRYALAQGLDVLVTSEHNHMFDGSSALADVPARDAKDRFAEGLRQAQAFNSDHPGFVAIYAQEWGRSAGGHLNILGADGIVTWERNRANALLGTYPVDVGDYASLYSLMREKGWLGQFNHPDRKQFKVNGVSYGYTPDGDEVMALAEVINSDAWSSNVTEGESKRVDYGGRFDTLLMRGFHVAPTSNQDNHCANWGSSAPNRTGLLIPAGQPLNQATVFDAIRARRVFATEDKHALVVLRANGHMMGERFSNRGALTLSVEHRSRRNRAVDKVTIYEGEPDIAAKPGRPVKPGKLRVVGKQLHLTFTPTSGRHFYYAVVVQDDKTRLWSAPIWIEQHADY